MYQFGWFSTGRDKAARDLLKTVHERIKLGEIRAELAFVFCNREPGESKESDLFLAQVESYHTPLVYYSYRNFKAGRASNQQGETLPQWRLLYDREVIAQLNGFQPDLGVLAGYMLIVGEKMCQRYNMINLHPAAPGGPTGTWQEVIRQLIERGAKESGVIMHLVTPELDKGPPVTYCTFPIRGKPFDKYWDEITEQAVAEMKRKQGEAHPLFKLIRKHGLAREFPLIIATLKAFSQGKIRINSEKQIVDTEGRPITGYNLTGEIDKLVKGAIS